MRSRLSIRFSRSGPARGAALLALVLAAPAAGVPIYLGDGIFTPTGVFRVESTSPGVPTALYSTGIGSVEDIHVDLANGRLYWVETRGTPATSVFRAADLNGSNLQTLLTLPSSDRAFSLAVDVPNQHIYFGPIADRGVWRMDFDGMNTTKLVDTGTNLVRGIELDLASGKVYWAESSATGRVRRADLNGSNAEDLFTNLGFSDDLELDLNSGLVYFLNRPSGGGAQSIQRGNLDGSGSAHTVVSGINPFDLALDPVGQVVFWSDISADQLRRVNFDGTGSGLLQGFNNAFAVETGLTVPEPATALCLAAGLAGLAVAGRRRARTTLRPRPL